MSHCCSNVTKLSCSTSACSVSCKLCTCLSASVMQTPSVERLRSACWTISARQKAQPHKVKQELTRMPAQAESPGEVLAFLVCQTIAMLNSLLGFLFNTHRLGQNEMLFTLCKILICLA